MFSTERPVTTIGTLRLRSAADPLAARLRAQALLDATNLRPASLPPSAVLVVRALRVEVGEVLSRAPDAGALRAWESALRASLDALARAAARPALGPVPAGAEAVCFADRAELLACATRDACEGRAADRWWWRRALGGGAPRVVTRAWAEAPEYAPGALAQLTRTGHARAFVEALPGDEARALGAAMLQRHGLHALASALSNAPSEAADVSPPARPRRAEPPWAAEEGELPTSYGTPRALLAAALTLARAPSRARSESFRRAFVAWLAAEDTREDEGEPEGRPALARWFAAETSRTEAAARSGEAREPPPRPASEAPSAAGHPESAVAEGAALPGARAAAREGPPTGQRAPVVRGRTSAQKRAPDGSTPGPQAAHEDSPARRSGPAPEASVRQDETPARRDEARATPPAAPETRGAELEAGAPAPEDVTVISTTLGGVFFLVFVGIRLGLYGDFSTPREPGIALPLWDWLALMGRALLGDGHDGDPLWALLASLAGRAEGVWPGEGFEPPPDWRAPEGWRDEGEPEPASCGADARPVDRWVAAIVPHVRARLLRALGAAPEELAAVLLVRAARVRVTASHLDVAMALAEHPVEVRRAGLDRDVGWVPAAGRYVAFQFE